MAMALRERVQQYPQPLRPLVGAAELADICRGLELRLERGEEHVRAAREAGQDVHHLESRWRDLLRAYERLSQLQSRRGD